MFVSSRLPEWVKLPLIRAHLCTLAVAVGFTCTWKVPRASLQYGGLSFGLAHTVAMATVALPITLLQLAVGQLSQHDAVGIWRAVPFFRGVGYLRLLTNFVGSVYTIVYVALSFTYFLYAISNSIPFWECGRIMATSSEGYENNTLNTSECLNDVHMGPIANQPEYYLAVAFIISTLWMVLPFIFYNPIKLMKRIFYVAGPLIVVMGIVIISVIGDTNLLVTMTKRSDWEQFLKPDIWYIAVIQALWSAQVAGGYLVSSGDSIYSSTNVQWTALAIVGSNVIGSWAGSLFWFGIGGSSEVNATNSLALLVALYEMAANTDINNVWPVLVLATLFFSGSITMLVLVYPIYDRCRRIGGQRWRLLSFGSSVVGGGVAVAALAGRLPLLALLEDIAVPLLISLATVLEICAFILIYGWRVLVEDVEFLTGRDLDKCWVVGWCIAPGVIAAFTAWWLTAMIMEEVDSIEWWSKMSTLVAAAGLAAVIFFAFAAVAVATQVQYDFIGKLKSSFKPSRHWGPRDPITHYYWLARREQACPGRLRTRFRRRHLGQLSGRPSFLHTSDESKTYSVFAIDIKRRNNSDDWLYTVYRRQYLEKAYNEYFIESRKRRSRSLDWAIVASSKTRTQHLDQLNHSKSADSIHPINNNTDGINILDKRIV